MRITKPELADFEISLIRAGYKKSGSTHKNEDYGYYKSVKFGEIGYQMSVLIYDWTKYPQHISDDIGISLNCYILSDKYERIDLLVTKEDMTLEQFEDYSKTFYNKMFIEYFNYKA